MKYFIFFRIIVLSMIIASVSCNAQELEIATLEFPPYLYMKNKKVTGLVKHVLNEVSKRSGIKFKLKFYPWSRAIHMAKESTVDGIIPILKNEKRKRYLKYTYPISKEEIQIYSKKNKHIKFTGDISKLYGHSIGKVRGFTLSPSLDKAINEGKFRKVSFSSSSLLNIKKLIEGRFDLLIDTNLVVLYYVKRNNLINDVNKVELPAYTTYNYLAFTGRVQNSVVKKYNFYLKQIKDDGTYKKLLERFLEEYK